MTGSSCSRTVSDARDARERPPAYATVMVPFMVGWNRQAYSNVPAASKVWLKVPPCPRAPLSNDPSLAVTVCCVPSSFVHVTVVPTATSSEAGAKAKPLIVTAAPSTGAAQSG